MNRLPIHIIFFLLLLSAFTREVYAQNPPPAGESIKNKVTTTYTEPESGQSVEIESNEVQVLVNELPRFDFYPNNSVKEFRGRAITFTHFVRNSGNVNATINVKGFNTDGDDFDLRDLSWVSGPEASKSKYSTISATDTISTKMRLEPGEELQIQYEGWISYEEERDTLQAVMVFAATDSVTGITSFNRDTVQLRLGVVMDIQKTQSGVTEDTRQGDSFTYHITGENVGDLTAYPREVVINNQQVERVVLIDSLPANLTFQSLEMPDKGVPLYHSVGSEEFEFTLTPPEDLANVDIIGVAYDSLQVGETFAFNFDVRINDNASGNLINVAQVTFTDLEGNAVSETASNEVVTLLPEVDAEISYYVDEDFEEETGTSSIGEPLHLQASASACNEDRSRIETVTIKITSELTGDMEVYEGTETGTNTGIFRVMEEVPTRNGDEFEVIAGNEILETVEDDVIIAHLECSGLAGSGGQGGPAIEAAVVVDPYGIVFDSETNAVIPGAEVRIYDVTGANNGGNAGGLATVYRSNGVEESDNIQISGSLGKYRFPFLRPGTYRIEVTPPEGYAFSSQLRPGQLPSGRSIDSLGSYGRKFKIEGLAMGLDFDIPLDPLSNGVLLARKTVDRKVAEIGDFVNYSIEVKSAAVNTVHNLMVYDKLPFGFEYQPGTARIDGEQIEDPEGGKGPDLVFTIGSLEPGATKTLTYRVYLGPGSDRSDGTNTAIVRSDELIVKTSNEAKIKIEVNGGVFNDEALIIGKVFLDCDEDNMQDGSEPGIPGVRLYLENGNYVITDSEGRYTFYAIKPNEHVLKIDNYSLPEGSKLKVLDNRHAWDPSSRFVDVTKGEMQRADFAVCECTAEVFEEINRRAEVLNGESKNSLAGSLKQNFSLQENSNQGGNAVSATGTIGNAKAPDFAPSSPDGKAVVRPDSSTIADSLRPDIFSAEELILKTDNTLGFMNITDGDTLPLNKQTIWVKGVNGADFNLYINGIAVDENRVGQRSMYAEKSVQAWEFVSITLEPGLNHILVEQTDPFGNVRGSEEAEVYVPGELYEVKLTVPRNNVSADGASAALIRVELVDKDGVRIGSRMPVMLDVSRGTWNVTDMDSKEPGTQVFIEGGVAEFELLSTIEPVTSMVRASVGSVYDEAKVEFLPDLRPLIAAGILEGTVRLTEPLNISRSVSNDGFERELTQLSYSFNSFTGDARFAFFLKGKISGKTLLTASYDSEKAEEERLFRDIRPEEFYPVYGESSVKGFDAQSSGRLYIRVDRGKTYALLGDFITQENDPDVKLGGYSRAQNGVKAHFEKGRAQLEVFGVNSISSRRIEEFRGQGISRYELPDDDILDNSEIIELVTYDREQPDLIINVQRLTRFTDYVIDPFTGVITFKAPVSSIDGSFNPVFIRATYEVENNEEQYFIGGARGKVEVANGLAVGAGVVQDNKPGEEFTMATGNVEYNIGKQTKVIAEVAHTIDETEGEGTAGRVELQQKGSRYEVRGEVGRSTDNFSNQGATLGKSRTEAKANGRYKITNSTSIKGEFLYSRNDTSGDHTIGSLMNLQQSISSGVNAEVGVRYSEQSAASGDVTNTNMRGKITADLPFIPGASTFGEYEQDITDADRRLIALGGDYRLRNIAKVYARHEFISSAGGRYTLNSNAQQNNTVVGIDANYMKDGQVFSEYRINDALDGRTGQASIGLRNRFMLQEGLGLNVGFERVFTVKGPNGSDGTAISSAVDYTGNPNWKGTARAEARFGLNTDTYLNSLGYGLKINRDWTFLARNIIAINVNENTEGIHKLQERLQIGSAFRDTDTNMFDALFRYEFKLEQDQSVAPEFLRTAHVVSSHANYHPFSRATVSGRVAAKYSITKDELTRSSSFLELVSGRFMYDLSYRWDAGINATLLANSDFTTRDYGLGVEVGFLLITNLRLATGFNFFGYFDEDLSQNNYTRKGAYLGFSFKFDEQIFKSLAPEASKNFIDESMYVQCIPCEMPELDSLDVDDPVYEIEPYQGDYVTHVQKESYTKMARFNPVILPRQVHFDNDKSYINRSTAQMLDKVAKFLMDRDNYIIDLSGFTDIKGSDAYNLALSERRSAAIRAYLISAGVNDGKLLIEGYGETNSEGMNIIEMSLERKVEIDLNDLNSQVTFVDQVEDLQVNQRARKIGGWDYIFKSEHNAVPLNINLENGSSTLNYLNRYMIQRVAMAMERYPEINVTISLPNDNRFMALQSVIMAELSQNQADITRFSFSRGTNSGYENMVEFTYTNAERLELYNQRDDVKFLTNKEVPGLIASLLRVLNSRADYELINDNSQSYVVPDRVNFMPSDVAPDNESQAVLSRIGSYLVNNPSVYLELYGDGSARDSKRMSTMKEYLMEWGVNEAKIQFGEGTKDTQGKAIRLEYKKADLINLRNIEFLQNDQERR